MKNEVVGDESSFVNRPDAPDKEDEEFTWQFDGLVRISEKWGVEILLHMTFNKEKWIDKCNGKERGQIKWVIWVIVCGWHTNVMWILDVFKDMLVLFQFVFCMFWNVNILSLIYVCSLG